MISNVWSVLCRDIITDQETNSVSYLRCIEEGSAASLPVRIGPLFLGTLWEKTGQEKESIMFRITLQAPGNVSQVLMQTKSVFLDRPRHRLNFRISSLNIADFGTYHVIVEYSQGQEWVQGSRLPVLIRKIQSQG
ncbi:hypothetical protein [Desulfonatronovibrio magnus]|uniref:hypothetical protein n=1 Tax=Desulfonatronovibrio magnus TaxID=698827 RepID=UPI0005EBBD2E|nr:hypothetical protein [Desulfonatronovibrio magnus]